jgi:hypothetical protein
MSLELETPKTIDGIDVSAWTPEQVAELRAALNDSVIADQDAVALLAEENAPAKVIANRRRLAAMKHRELADAKALRDAKVKFGENDVGVFPSREGDIIMRTASPAEDDELSSRANAARDRGAPEEEIEFVKWEVLTKTVCHPSRTRLDEIVKKYPRVKGRVVELYVALVECATDRSLGK